MNGTTINSASKIAQNIRSIREHYNLTQAAMGNALGYSERQVRRIESDGTTSLVVIGQIAEKYNISAIDILFNDEMSFCLLFSMI